MKIEVVPYQDSWIDQFNKLKSIIDNSLSSIPHEIEHIGSTSVPGLAAKPIIDIMVGIDINNLENVISPLTQNGFIYYRCFDHYIPNRRYFVRILDEYRDQFKSIYTERSDIPSEKIHQFKYAHVHVWPLNSLEWKRHLAFRNYLISHPKQAEEYGKLKLKLSDKDWKDGIEYNEAKEAFILEIQKIALNGEI